MFEISDEVKAAAIEEMKKIFAEDKEWPISDETFERAFIAAVIVVKQSFGL